MRDPYKDWCTLEACHKRVQEEVRQGLRKREFPFEVHFAAWGTRMVTGTRCDLYTYTRPGEAATLKANHRASTKLVAAATVAPHTFTPSQVVGGHTFVTAQGQHTLLDIAKEVFRAKTGREIVEGESLEKAFPFKVKGLSSFGIACDDEDIITGFFGDQNFGLKNYGGIWSGADCLDRATLTDPMLSDTSTPVTAMQSSTSEPACRCPMHAGGAITHDASCAYVAWKRRRA